MSDSTCVPHHDWFTAALTFGLCCGLVISYVPQHYRIISSGSSEGLSPVFLFLGVTSAGSGMLNMFIMQWSIVRCCRFLSFGSCIEMTAGVIQVSLQWAMFSLIMVLYILYYPSHLKYVSPPDADVPESRPLRLSKGAEKTREWKLSIVMTWLAIIHLLVITFSTAYLLTTFTPAPAPHPTPSPDPLPSPSPDGPSSHSVSSWATFLGLTSALLAAIQYIPQIIHTYKHKLVGALSIPMMLIQTPGAVLMVLSIALRPGTNWTSWATFAVAGCMQGTLLVMCILWKFRQRKLGIDDFGNPVEWGHESYLSTTSSLANGSGGHLAYGHPAADLDVPGLVAEDEDAAAIRVALANALESAVEEDVRSGGIRPVQEMEIPVHEQNENTPLLDSGKGHQPESTSTGWFGRFKS